MTYIGRVEQVAPGAYAVRSFSQTVQQGSYGFANQAGAIADEAFPPDEERFGQTAIADRHPNEVDEVPSTTSELERRSTPDRIHEAKRAGLRARMVDDWRLLPARADELLDEWEAEAARLGQERTDATTGPRRRSGCALAPAARRSSARAGGATQPEQKRRPTLCYRVSPAASGRPG